MKIQLEYPYNTRWKNGYIVTNKENRKMVILVNNRKDRTTTAYARYLLSCKEQRFLTNEEQTDHIDNDKTNDSLENLQILSPLQNHNKSLKVGQTMIKFICPICDKHFELTARQSHRLNPTCSKKCGGIKAHWK